MYFPIAFWALSAAAVTASPLCGAASAMIVSADLHLAAWNRQLDVLTPGNCTQVYQFLYASHSRVLEGLQTELTTLREELDTTEAGQTVSDESRSVNGVSSVAAASSLLSAQMHGISYMTTNFRSCFDADRDLHLMTLILLRHAKNLMPGELRAVWLSLQNGVASSNTEISGKTIAANVQFLQRATDTYAGDLPMLGSIVKRLIENTPISSSAKKSPVKRMRLVEAVYQDTFEENSLGSEIFRPLFSARVLENGLTVADFAACFGNFIAPLRESPIFAKVDAFDAIDDIETATHGRVIHITEDAKIDSYDVVFAIGVFGRGNVDLEQFVLAKLKAHALKYAVVSVPTEMDVSRLSPEFEQDAKISSLVRDSITGKQPDLSLTLRVLKRVN